MQRTTDLDRHVGGLVADTNRTNVVMRNTVNEFLLLSNTQFIESRVWNEDVREMAASGNVEESTSAPLEDPAASVGDAEGAEGADTADAVIDERYREAMSLGLAALERTAFGKVAKAPVAPVFDAEGLEIMPDEVGIALVWISFFFLILFVSFN